MRTLRFFGAIAFVVFCCVIAVSTISRGVIEWWTAFPAAGFFVIVPAIAVFILSGPDAFKD